MVIQFILTCRTASLVLIRKMIRYVNVELLEELCAPGYLTVNFASLVTEVISIVLDLEVMSIISLTFCFVNI